MRRSFVGRPPPVVVGSAGQARPGLEHEADAESGRLHGSTRPLARTRDRHPRNSRKPILRNLARVGQTVSSTRSRNASGRCGGHKAPYGGEGTGPSARRLRRVLRSHDPATASVPCRSSGSVPSSRRRRRRGGPELQRPDGRNGHHVPVSPTLPLVTRTRALGLPGAVPTADVRIGTIFGTRIVSRRDMNPWTGHVSGQFSGHPRRML